MNFADLHCDTPLKMFTDPTESLHISPQKASCFEKYTQVAAFWSNYKKTDSESYSEFLDIYDSFMYKFKKNVCFSKADMISNNSCIILSIEDLRIVENKPERLSELHSKGIRIGTLTWKDVNILGGAWNTNSGLSDYGRIITEKMIDIGIIPDVSHGSRKLISDVYDICKAKDRTFCATHSNSFAVCPHYRNLADDDARLIAHCGGIIGISLYPAHLSEKNADIDTVIDHIDHYVNTVGFDHVGFGCDFDGIDSLPYGIDDVSSVVIFHDKLSKKYSESIAEKILYSNVNNYLLNNI